MKYESAEINEDFNRSIFIVLPNKPRTKECELRRIISLMSHKIIHNVKIQMNGHQRFEPEIDKEQCNFVQDVDTRNYIFKTRASITKSEKPCVCFIVNTKTFEKNLTKKTTCKFRVSWSIKEIYHKISNF